MLTQNWEAVDQVMKTELDKLDTDPIYRKQQLTILFESIEYFSKFDDRPKKYSGLIEMQDLFIKHYYKKLHLPK